jgi:hypothetical protein
MAQGESAGNGIWIGLVLRQDQDAVRASHGFEQQLKSFL